MCGQVLTRCERDVVELAVLVLGPALAILAVGLVGLALLYLGRLVFPPSRGHVNDTERGRR